MLLRLLIQLGLTFGGIPESANWIQSEALRANMPPEPVAQAFVNMPMLAHRNLKIVLDQDRGSFTVATCGVSISKLPYIIKRLPFHRPNPRMNERERRILQQTDQLIQLLEDAIKQLEMAGIDDKQLDGHRKELKELYRLRDDLKNKAKE